MFQGWAVENVGAFEKNVTMKGGTHVRGSRSYVGIPRGGVFSSVERGGRTGRVPEA